MHKNFTSGNIADGNVTQWITNAERNINAFLGITTDLTATELTQCNAEEVCLLYCAIDACNYDPDTLFTNTSEFAMQLDAFYAKLGLAKATLVSLKGQGAKPTDSSFTVMSSSE